MKYDRKKFSEGFTSKKYRDGWERTFGKNAKQTDSVSPKGEQSDLEQD